MRDWKLGNVEAETGVLCRAENLCLCGPYIKVYNKGYRQLNGLHGFDNLSKEGKECLYAVIGGVVGAVLTMAVGHIMPIGVQNGDATFGEITCTGLDVVDSEGKIKISLGNGYVRVRGEGGVYG